MRILHAVLSEGFYGSERYCGELAVEQTRQGHDVEVVTLGGDSDCTRAMRQLLTLVRAGTSGELALAVVPRALPAALQRPLARALLRRFRPHIVHSHLDPAARRIGRTAQRMGFPHVATLHLNFSAHEYGACDGLILIADWQRKTLPADFSGLVAVVRNWLPAAVTDGLKEITPGATDKLRRTWGADDQAFVFGSVGRLVPEKGMDVLIRAFGQAFPRREDPVRLVIVGDGPERARLIDLASGDPRIVFAGAQSNVAPFYSGLDAYVNAARFEPFGMAILEAMAAGCPLVLSRSEGPVEFVTDARVLWVDIDDQSTLAQALANVWARGRQRLAYALDDFAPQRAAAEIEQVYARVLAQSGRQSV